MSQSTTSEIAGSLSAPLMLLINGFMGSQVVHVPAELGVADPLADSAKTAEALAQQSGTHAPSLHRLLRALASLGLLDEVEPGQFALTALGAQLRTAVPGSLRNRALLFGGERHWRSWGELLRSVRTGETAMQHLYGMGGPAPPFGDRARATWSAAPTRWRPPGQPPPDHFRPHPMHF
jgi:hypothetical protein